MFSSWWNLWDPILTLFQLGCFTQSSDCSFWECSIKVLLKFVLLCCEYQPGWSNSGVLNSKIWCDASVYDLWVLIKSLWWLFLNRIIKLLKDWISNQFSNPYLINLIMKSCRNFEWYVLWSGNSMAELS